MTENVLKIEDLRVEFLHEEGYAPAVKGVTFSVERGRTLGIVGESGSGKSVSAMAAMGLLPAPPRCRMSGFVSMPGIAERMEVSQWQQELGRRQLRGSALSMIFQEPMTSLNPVHRCGDQVMEMLLQHEAVPRPEARQRVLDLFQEVLLPRPEQIFDSYPHEISGGQKQRVMIAMALVCRPALLIADEPTTALDVTVQKAIIDLLRTLRQRHNIGIIFISHDLGVVAQIADRVAVMYRGEIVEQGDADQVLHHPRHPYTQGLLACRPPLDSRPLCLPTVKDFMEGAEGQSAISFSPLKIQNPNPTLHNGSRPDLQSDKIQNPNSNILEVRDLRVTYSLHRNFFGKPTLTLDAVDGISFDIRRGETLGLVGESGCGKSTLGRALLQLISHNSGSILFDGQPLDKLSASQRKALRRKVQIVFQDPYSSLNPRLTVGEAILEPLRCHHIGASDAERRERVLSLMRQVGLEESWYSRYPHEFSGGQRQRVCIARALILEPELVVCDECVSALDVSVQAQVLNLLNDLKAQHGYTYLFITHDLSVVKFLSDRIMVMEKGRIVESAPADELYAHPQHPYTRRLLSAIPRL